MTFNMKFSRNKYGKHQIEIQINEFLESNFLMSDFWSPFQYRKQWAKALKFLYEKRVNNCLLVTCIRPRHISQGLMYYAFYTDNDIIYIREIMHYEGLGHSRIDPEMLTDPIRVEKYIPDRDSVKELKQNTEDGFPYPVSEWIIDFNDISNVKF